MAIRRSLLPRAPMSPVSDRIVAPFVMIPDSSVPGTGSQRNNASVDPLRHAVVMNSSRRDREVLSIARNWRAVNTR
jgi:hypothetical protein